MRIVERRIEGASVVVLDIEGRIVVLDEAEAIGDRVDGLVRRGERRILLNMAEVHHMSLFGLGEIVRCYSRASRSGAKVALLGLTKRVRDLLDAAKLLTVIPNFDDEREAVAELST